MVTTRRTDSPTSTVDVSLTKIKTITVSHLDSGSKKKRVTTMARPRPPTVPRRRILHSSAPKKRSTKFTKKGSNAINRNGETVDTVKMLTGTLYMYKGPEGRRVEFVRNRDC